MRKRSVSKWVCFQGVPTLTKWPMELVLSTSFIIVMQQFYHEIPAKLFPVYKKEQVWKSRACVESEKSQHKQYA